MSDNETIHRHDEGGPTADVTCDLDGPTATAHWTIPGGQLNDAANSPVNTGGYVYFSLHEMPSTPLRQEDGGEFSDFSGAELNDPTLVNITTRVELGEQYRAHVLLSYEDGPTWHNDTVFVCEAPVEVSATPAQELPFTGPDPMLPVLGTLALAVGAIMVWLGRSSTWNT